MSNSFISMRISLLWRTVLLLTLFVLISQSLVYVWIQRSVNEHFDVMDSEILTHAAFNIRKNAAGKSDELIAEQLQPGVYNHDFNYDVQVFAYHLNGQLVDGQEIDDKLLSYPLPTEQAIHKQFTDRQTDVDNQASSDSQNPLTSTTNLVSSVIDSANHNKLFNTFSNFKTTNKFVSLDNLDILKLYQKYNERQFKLKLGQRRYRAIIIQNEALLYLIILPIDSHLLYLTHFNIQLRWILIGVTLLMVTIAALSVYSGFSPLSTFVHKMKRISPNKLSDRVVVSEMPQELRPLANSYNVMMDSLEANFESLSRFSDNIAHELRTPIATLSTQTQVMLSQPRDSVDYVEQLHHQHDTLEQLSTLINNMLLLAKTQKELSPSQMSRIDSEGLISKLLEYYEFIAEDKGIVFDKSGEFGFIQGDASLLQRLFSNLLSNAVYYAKENSVIRVHASNYVLESNDGQPAQNKLKIVIENELTQPMNQVQADRLFERFYRHNKSQNSHAGTGLGLSIVQSIAEVHKGQVGIDIKNQYIFQIWVIL